MRIPMGLALALLAVAVSGCDPLSAAELKRQAGTVDSIAAEGAILAGQVAEERAKETFVRVHSDDLSSEMEHTVEKLSETEEEGEVPDEIEPQLEETIELAGDAADALDELRLNPGDERQARETEQKLEEISEQAGDLADELDRL
jgi:hypothetical protein